MKLVRIRTGSVIHTCGEVDGGQPSDPWYYTLCGLDEWACVGERWEVVDEGEVTCKRCLRVLKANSCEA